MEMTADTPLPKKRFFKMGEAVRLVGVRSHVLRYWEQEIAQIRPSKSASNQRRYRRQDVAIFRELKDLLHNKRYTLAGAQSVLSSLRDDIAEVKPKPRELSVEGNARIQQLRDKVLELVELVQNRSIRSKIR